MTSARVKRGFANELSKGLMADPAARSSWPPPVEVKQSITEVLQNPRGELRETLDFRGAPAPPPPPRAPPDAPVTINDFEQYLRELAPLYDEAPLSPLPAGGLEMSKARTNALDDVPNAYYDDSFAVAQSEDLAGLLASDESAPLDRDRVDALRIRLSAREEALRAELRGKLSQRANAVDAALEQVRALRSKVLATAMDVADARDRATIAVDAVANPVVRIDDVVGARKNALNVLQTLRLVKRVRAAAGDVPVLLDTGQYAAAIDAVHSARDALQSSQLRGVHALAAARARLARAVESIDARLRSDFRTLTRGNEDTVDDAQVLAVADLCARIGRMEVLRRTYLDDVAMSLAKELSELNDLGKACSVVRARVAKAAKVLRALHTKTDSNEKKVEDEGLRPAFEKLYAVAQDVMCTVIDRLMKTFPVSLEATPGAFIVLRNEGDISEVSCFDEAKAAIRFTELARSLNQLADDLATDLDLTVGVGGPLRAKCRERILAFIDAFHKAHVEAVTTSVRADEWKEVVVSEGTARLVTSVVGSAGTSVNTPAESERKRVAGPMPTPRVSKARKPKKLRIPLVMKGETYYAVRCGLRFARSLCAYALVVDKIPLVSSAAARRGVELSILFNSLVCQAILGAAALEWAGIKTITARHLALASRTVAMAEVLSTATHDALKGALPPAQAGVVVPLMEKASSEFGDSQRQLLAKITTIMMQRLGAHETTLRNLPWGSKSDMQRMGTPSYYMDRLVGESDLLHRILWSLLPAKEVGDIFERVCVAFGNHLADAYNTVDMSKSWVRKRVTADTSHLYSELLRLDVFEVAPDALKPVERLFKTFSAVEDDSVKSAGTTPVKEGTNEGTPAKLERMNAHVSGTAVIVESTGATPVKGESALTTPVKKQAVDGTAERLDRINATPVEEESVKSAQVEGKVKDAVPTKLDSVEVTHAKEESANAKLAQEEKVITVAVQENTDDITEETNMTAVKAESANGTRPREEDAKTAVVEKTVNTTTETETNKESEDLTTKTETSEASNATLDTEANKVNDETTETETDRFNDATIQTETSKENDTTAETDRDKFNKKNKAGVESKTKETLFECMNNDEMLERSNTAALEQNKIESNDTSAEK